MQNQDAISEPRNRIPMESQKSKGSFFFSLLKHVKHHAHAPTAPFQISSIHDENPDRPSVKTTTTTTTAVLPSHYKPAPLHRGAVALSSLGGARGPAEGNM